MTTCAYWSQGNAKSPPVVLLHAIATDSSLWAPQVQVWSSVFRVIGIDLPGHGGSADPVGVSGLEQYADNVREVLDELGVESASFVGLSFGGMVAQAFALKYPQRTRALVLAHTSARTEKAVKEIWDGRIRQFEKDGLSAQIPSTIERWFTRTFAAASPLTLQWLAGLMERTTEKGYISAIHAIQRLDHLDRLNEISADTLIIVGEEDSAVPPAAAKIIAEKMKNATFVVLEAAAHLSNLEQPVIFTETVGAFLSRSNHG